MLRQGCSEGTQDRIKQQKGNKIMEAKARQTGISMPARKLRRVINLVRGKSADDAISMLKYMPYFAARVVEKNLVAAMSNAVEQYGVSASSLRIYMSLLIQ